MAAKFGATIVPFAAIGADEAVTTHINGDELERLQKLLPQPPQLPQLPFDLPFLPRQQRKPELSAEERRARIPRARKGVNAMEEDLEAFMSVGVSTQWGLLFGLSACDVHALRVSVLRVSTHLHAQLCDDCPTQ
jgi:hypothetical protein